MDEKLNELLSLMHQTKQAFFQQAQMSFEDQTATILQCEALTYIHENGNVTVSELASYLQISPSSTTQLIERLVKGEYVTRSQDESDRRIVRLGITTACEEQLQKMKQQMLSHMKQLFRDIPTRDIDELIRIQSTIVSNLKKHA